MARAKKCEEEFNPWPPFVDVFSSVILVLLLFILVTIVNIAYYMQFNSKVDSTSKTKSQTNNLQKGQDTTKMVTLKKEIIQVKAKTSNLSIFSGGKSEGNAMTMKKEEEKLLQKVEKTKNGITIVFNNKEIFISKKVKKQIKEFAKKNKNKKFIIKIIKPTISLSPTISRQISIGRTVVIKNKLKMAGIPLENITLTIDSTKNTKYKNGAIEIVTK